MFHLGRLLRRGRLLCRGRFKRRLWGARTRAAGFAQLAKTGPDTGSRKRQPRVMSGEGAIACL